MSHRSTGAPITTRTTTSISTNVRGPCTSFAMNTFSISRRSVVVEVPQAGHATYVFSKPPDVKHWVWQYAKTTRQDIRHNRGNIAESLGFQGRIVHGKNKSEWLRELRVRTGEPPDPALGGVRLAAALAGPVSPLLTLRRQGGIHSFHGQMSASRLLGRVGYTVCGTSARRLRKHRYSGNHNGWRRVRR